MAREPVTFMVELVIETDANEPGWESDDAYLYVIAELMQSQGWHGSTWRSGRFRNSLHAGAHGIYR